LECISCWQIRCLRAGVTIGSLAKIDHPSTSESGYTYRRNTEAKEEN
jgi:hypothetical protein